jgi:hypothetical protein
MSRQLCFITANFRQEFTLPSFGSPRLPEHLMRYTSKQHDRWLSFSFGPSLQTGSYYDLC